MRWLERTMVVEGNTTYNEYANFAQFDLCCRSVRGLLHGAHRRDGIGVRNVTWVGPFNDLYQAPHVCANIVYRDRYRSLESFCFD